MLVVAVIIGANSFKEAVVIRTATGEMILK